MKKFETYSKKQTELHHIIVYNETGTIESLITWVIPNWKENVIVIMTPTSTGSLEGNWYPIPKNSKKKDLPKLLHEIYKEHRDNFPN